MNKKSVSNGLVHKTHLDLRNVITSSKTMHEAWEGISPIARNEWICWIESAKKLETRNKRIKRTREELTSIKGSAGLVVGRGVGIANNLN